MNNAEQCPLRFSQLAILYAHAFTSLEITSYQAQERPSLAQ